MYEVFIQSEFLKKNLIFFYSEAEFTVAWFERHLSIKTVISYRDLCDRDFRQVVVVVQTQYLDTVGTVCTFEQSGLDRNVNSVFTWELQGKPTIFLPEIGGI